MELQDIRMTHHLQDLDLLKNKRLQSFRLELIQRNGLDCYDFFWIVSRILVIRWVALYTLAKFPLPMMS